MSDSTLTTLRERLESEFKRLKQVAESDSTSSIFAPATADGIAWAIKALDEAASSVPAPGADDGEGQRIAADLARLDGIEDGDALVLTSGEEWRGLPLLSPASRQFVIQVGTGWTVPLAGQLPIFRDAIRGGAKVVKAPLKEGSDVP